MANITNSSENLASRVLCDANGKNVAKFIWVMNTTCVFCKETIRDQDGLFLALEWPYNGLLHRRCAPLFSYDNEWPHAAPVSFYCDKGKLAVHM